MNAVNQSRQLKGTLLFLTLFILVIQFYFLSLKLPFDVAYTNKTVGFFSIYLSKLTQSFFLWLPLIYFMLAHILIQTVLTIVIFWISKQLLIIFPSVSRNLFLVGVIFWFVSQLNIYLLNWYLYPYSFFSIYLTKFPIPRSVLLFLLCITSLLIIFILACILGRTLKNKPRALLAIGVFFAAVFIASYLIRTFSSDRYFKQFKKPNIIIIITDSLRPDYANSKIKKTKGPVNVQNFITHAAFFSNSLTLLGRSTPGLVSILTGNYPKTNGARFNLIPSNYLHLENNLTKILKSNGYQTIFAADGRQFINIDNHYYFDQVISAKPGIYDFIFTLINDTPLSNLLMNSIIGKTLFPYNYANRNSYYTYLPSSFTKLVDRDLRNLDTTKPVLFIGALTIAHWPYVWAWQPNFSSLSDRYENSVLQLDKQFGALLDLLKKRGLLKNSIVITLSDHGDSLGLPGDRIITPQTYQGPANRLTYISRFPYNAPSNTNLIGMDTSAGHGTDLLSLTQLQTTLAFSSDHIKPQTITQRVALIDVLPTLLDLLALKTSPGEFDGISLKPLLSGKSTLTEFNRPIFLESEIDIPLIDVTKEKQNSSTLSRLINQYSNLYDIDGATGQLVLKDAAISSLLTEKQRGVIFNNWLLVKFPGKNRLTTDVLPSNSPKIKDCYYSFPAKTSEKSTKVFCYHLAPTEPYYVLVNLSTKKWRIYLANEKISDPIFNSLLKKLYGFYQDELNN